MPDKQTQFNDFETAAHESFDFLCTDYRFRCVCSQPGLVRYESSSVYFEIGYCVSHDNEVYSCIGRLGFPGVLARSPESICFGLFLAVADADGYAARRREVPYSIATTEWQVRRVLSYFASGLKRYGLPLLSGDESAYADANQLRWWHAPDVPPGVIEVRIVED